jgi:hypothetical protein
MVQRFWWAAAVGAYGGHGEVLPNFSGSGGELVGQSPQRIAWFKRYIDNTTLHPPFEECVGDDDGFVHTLTCGTDFILFHFYNGHHFANNSFQYINLPVGKKLRQDLLQPWEMKISVVWAPPTCSDSTLPCATCKTCDEAPPPADAVVWGPERGAGWSAVGITVDEDTLPHILTFTDPKRKGGKNHDKEQSAAAAGSGEQGERSWLSLPAGLG